MKVNRYIFLALTAILFASSCSRVETPDVVDPDKYVASPIISAVCVTENAGAGLPYLATRSIIDQVTTQSMQANFIRINEDVKGGEGTDKNDGTYTFKGGPSSNPYTTVNWERASMLEASVISSPDNTPNIFYRSISFNPVQSYSIIASVENPDALVPEYDTTHFYHTRMVGWYPQSCVLPLNDKGKAVYTLFDDERFDAVRDDAVNVNGRARVGITFTNLDGSKDVMVSNVKEAQHLHEYKASPNTHKSDISPIDSSNIYRSPFGHYTSGPVYSNYFTYKHYLSAVRVWAYADQSQQNLDMWGSINNVVFQDQPQSCKIWLPEELDTEWGEVYEWGVKGNNNIITTPMFGDDVNHSDENYEASYPISLQGAGDAYTKIYLGYSLIKPNSDIELELHTTNGVYVVDVASIIDSTKTNIFDAGYVYDVMLNLKTTGTIAVLLENESSDHYYDLTTLSELEVGGEKTISAYKYANCYIVSPKDQRYQRMDTVTNSYVPYEGFCFAATTVGNGSDGIKNYGSQPMYPSTASINPSYAQLVWESSLGLVSEVELLYGYVRFKVPNPELEGNAVLGVYDSNNNLLWSWHVWITDYPEDKSFTVGTKEYTLLDRNLGATKSVWTDEKDALETYGLYYQWGRKDPSMGPMSYDYPQINLMCADYYDYSSQKHNSAEVKQITAPTMKDGVENPMYLILPTQKTNTYTFNWLYDNNNILWGASTVQGVTTVSKTIYDPCPFGYRVPASELSTLIANSREISTGTYGQIRQSGSTDFYFPYAGFKGVDKGLNSIVGEWKYVGKKGDYQSALYSTASGSNYLHRSRMYISKDNSWKETGVGDYYGNTNQDYTNRRTAASIRCVKINDYGIVSSSLTVNPIMVCGSTLSIAMNAQSSGSEISTVKLERVFRRVGSDVDETELIETYTPTNASSFNKTYDYTVPAESEFVSSGKYQDQFTFVLTVTNKLGVTQSSSATTARLQFIADFSNWITVANPLVGVNEPLVGQPVKLTVTLKCSSTFGSVTINGQNATGPTTPSQNAQGLFEGTYYVTSAVFSVAGNKKVSIYASIGESDVEVFGTVPVWGIEKGTAVAGISSFNNLNYYLIQHMSYPTTYISATSSTANTLEAKTGADYSSLFRMEANASNSSFNAYNVQRSRYINGATNTLSLSTNKTNYYLKDAGSPFRITSSSESVYTARYYFWCQSSDGFIVSRIRYYNSDYDDYKWNFYQASFIDPDTL